MKRIIAMLLAIVLLMGMLPVQAFATESEPQETAACTTEGCTYGADHEGDHSVVPTCETEGCEYASGHEGNCSNWVAAEPETVAVESISMEQLLVLTVGQSMALTAVVAPENATEKAVTWTSSDSAVATVEDGVVTPLAEGKALITAAAGEHSAVCKVAVRLPEGYPVMLAGEEITEVSDQAGLAAMASAAGSYQLTADITLDSSWAAITLRSGTVFDGNGHTITLNGAPLFAKVNSGDTIRNVILDGSVTGSSSVGSLAVIGNGMIRNCASYADVTYTGTGTDSSGWMVDYAAGLVGSMTASSTVIDNCLYAGTLSLGSAQVYGSVANRQFYVTGTISNCIGVGSDRIGSDEGFSSHAAIDVGTNTVIADPAGFAAADYADTLNAGLQAGDLTWGVADGRLVPGTTATDGDEDNTEEEEKDPNGIYEQADLSKLAAAGTYTLMADITLSDWTSMNLPAGVTLNGNGHVITLSGTPLIGKLNGTVQNLILTGSVSGSSGNVAPLCRVLSSNAVIRNCVSDVTVVHSEVSSWPGYAGGLAAECTAGSATVSNCLILGSVTTQSALSAAVCVGFSAPVIENCVAVGYTELAVQEFSSTKITGTNCTLIPDAAAFAPAAYVSVMNANVADGDLQWSVKDGLLAPWGAASEDDGGTTEPEAPAFDGTLIYTLDDLKKMQAEAGAYKLMADLELDSSWSAMSPASDGITLDGNGHTITLNGAPLFSILNEKDVVTNLTLTGTVSDDNNIGAVTRNNYGTIRNCKAEITLSHTGYSWDAAGGFVGVLYDSGTVTNSFAMVTIAAKNTEGYGGIVGSYDPWSSSMGTISGCYVAGTDRIASTMDWMTDAGTAVGTEGNTLLESGYDAQTVADALNANLQTGDLRWSVVDGVPVISTSSGGADTPSDPDATQEALDALNAAIAAAEAVDTITKIYTLETISAWNTALENAKEAAAADSKKQSAIVAATEELTAAQNALTEKPTSPVDLTDVTIIEVDNTYFNNNMDFPIDGAYYVLTENITVGTYWFGSASTFNSVLDGNGYTITLSGRPLYGAIGENGVIQNLGIKGAAHNSTNDTGAIAKDSSGLIVNCWSQATVTSEGQNSTIRNTGGFVANLKSGGAIVNSYVAGTVTARGTTGTGAAGALAGTGEANTLVLNSYWLDSSGSAAVGSAAGAVTGSAAKTDAEFKDTANVLAALNSGRGTGKEWTQSSSGYPHLGEAQTYVPEAAVEITFTAHDGKETTFLNTDGLSINYSDVAIDGTSAFAGTFSCEGAASYINLNSDSTNQILWVYDDGALHLNTSQRYGTVTIQVGGDNGTIAKFPLTVREPKDACAMRLTVDGIPVEDTLEVEGSENIYFGVQIQDEEGGPWRTIPSSLITFQGTGNVHVSGASCYAAAPGTSTVTASGLGQTASVQIESSYVAVTSIRPAVEDGKTYTVHGRNANSDGSGEFLDLMLSHGVGTVIVEPANASYRNSWTMSSSDPEVVEYVGSMLMAVLPKKAGTVTLTAEATGEGETAVGSSTITIAYFNPVTAVTVDTTAPITVKENERVTLPIAFTGPESANGYHVTEPGMVWSFSGDGEAEIIRADLGVIVGEEGSKEYCIANDEYILKGIKAGTVTVTGTPVDTTGGADPVTFTVTVESGAPLTPADNDKLIADGISGAQKYLTDNAPQAYVFGNEWDIFSLTRSGRELTQVQILEYLQSAEEQVSSLTKPTDLARAALTLRVLGEDPTNFAGQNLISRLYNSDQITATSNEAMWALIALDMDGYNTPSDALWTRAKLIDEILAYQNSESGGFGLNDGESTSVDMTGMAIQALAPYYSTDADVTAAVDKALTYLQDQMDSDCGFGGAESAAQVLVALSALKVDLLKEENGFVKNVATNLITNITSYQDPVSGGFRYGDTLSKTPTIQSLYGLEAYRRFRDQENSLYDLSDVEKNTVPAYKITVGTNSTWQKDGAALEIGCDGAFAKFVGVKVDGTPVDSANYTAREGSTLITFSAEYLQTLALGKHTVTLLFSDGEASTLLTIAASDAQAVQAVEALIDAIGTVTKDSKEKIEAARAAYDALTDAQKAQVSNHEVLVAAEKAYDALLEKITVTVAVWGDYVHNSDEDGVVHSLGNGLTLWASGSVTVNKGATVAEALNVLLAANGMSCSNSGNYISSITYGGTTLGEFTNGVYSGWYYNLNGARPGLGVNEQIVQNGDQIVFHYTDNYTGVSAAAAIKQVEKLIDAIGTVALDSEAKIAAARVAYDKLTDAQKAKVSNVEKLLAAEETLSNLQIKNAETLISGIGTVTLNSKDKINAAWNAYNDLTAAQKLKVSNRGVLAAAQNTYNALRAEEVEDLIDEIDKEITLDSEKEIQKARKAYNALSKTQKDLVDKESLDKLKAAELALAELQSTENDKQKAQTVIDRIDQLGRITLDSEKDIEAARKAYDKLTDVQKSLVTNYDALLKAEQTLAALKRYARFEDIYMATGDYLEDLGTPNVGSVGGEWMVIGLARSGRDISEVYYANVLSYVALNIDENERLHKTKSTDNSRLILALTAIGKDVTDVDNHDLLKGLSDMAYVQKQGINGPIYALLALDSGNYPGPETGDVSREALIRVILDAQLPDGGWALSGKDAQPDMTAMALQALAPYYGADEEVAFAVEDGLAVLSEIQNGDGGYSDADGTTSESISQVIVALTALGIDPEQDERFVKNETSVLDALIAYYVDGGGFAHLPDGDRDGMATEQAYYALTAYHRMLSGSNSLYDMTDVIDMGADRLPTETTESVEILTETEEEDDSPVMIWIGVTVISALAVAAVILGRKKVFKF